MRMFVSTSSSSDSTYLLYKLLTETSHEIVSRLFSLSAQTEELHRYKNTCRWLESNVRAFDHRISEFESDHSPETTKGRLLATGTLSERLRCDSIAMGYNTHNWSHSNWYFNDNNIPKRDTDAFYNKRSVPSRNDHTVIRTVTDMPIHWPMMINEASVAIGRWETWSNLPQELKELVTISCKNDTYSTRVCDKCMNCVGHKWFDSGIMSPRDMDDCIMKYGKYGRYLTPESTPKTRVAAYDSFVENSCLLAEEYK